MVGRGNNYQNEVIIMKNGHGQIKNREQYLNPKTGQWVVKDTTSGKFLRVKKSDDKPFKNIRKK